MEELLLMIKYLFLGVVQGFTEPIPISSSGHLVLMQHFFGIEIKGMSFELLVNSASLIAVLLIYREDIWRLMQNGYLYVTKREEKAKADFRFIMYLIVATIPAGVIGVLFEDYISENLKGITTLGIALIVTGVALWSIRNLRGRKNDSDLSLKDAIIIGLAQVVALIPGISRSGATIVAAMSLGTKQETALRFSFLLFIPVSLGGMILSLSDIFQDPQLGTLAIPYTLAFFGSLIASYFSLRWFMNIMAKGNLVYFAIYCFIVGAAVLIFS
ncbi:undecaprenyl-diphosphate phosphatase [Bacillus massiliigorillae]|uniref:undecaprenyl-diphosphate phosphatase n=1 Tax=Bacillus massiliigorillae TaxID=1243664 RepID=UPI0003A10E73|nr:undecaprenyl-diphosphate phosphatase [Bacillus massiliigorillae]